MNESQKSLLKKARDTYGNKNQILVCMEELNELGAVLAKYPRFKREEDAAVNLRQNVLDEVADVTIILEHVKSIIGITDEMLDDRITKKLERLERWLEHSTSMQETIDDRAIKESCCASCSNDKNNEQVYEEKCVSCLKAQATEGRAINFEQ